MRAAATISGGRRIVKPYEMRQKEAGPGAKSCTEPTREAKRTAKVSITVRHLSIISSCPFCKDAHDAANCTELQKTDVQTPSMAVKRRMDNAWLSIAFLTLVPRAPLFRRTWLMHWDALHHITWFQILPAVATKSRTTAYHPHFYALAERMNMKSVQ
ncbi:conserved hypothetical protein [Trichinella spiralis]|uniref:hypothetical protein n=1 Tax=Trichinella spiralis TaxID=6334 RepID=UPI0001EFEF0C|nr:conserved hypothetical protein [Trichinella spiralis]